MTIAAPTGPSFSARLALCFLACLNLSAIVRADEASAPRAGWTSDFIGAGRGNATISLGARFWEHDFRFRNLLARGTLDLVPGVRAHLIARRREGSWSRMPLHPDIDEAYLEGLRFYRSPALNLAFNLKVGRIRYLAFPYPDPLQMFDPVPGIADLTGGPETDYRGAIFTFEGAIRSGFGFHFGGIQWGFDAPQSGANAIEWYGFYRHRFPGEWSVEGRAGGIAARSEPLGRPAHAGGSFFLGKGIGDFDVGAMVEARHGDRTYTGIMVRFRPTKITRFLGTVGFDYDRNPDGIALQTDLWSIRIGEGRRAAPDEELVGEIHAVRIRTFWQAGFQRNEYEHRVSSWGEAGGPNTRCVVEEEPWTLDSEAIVSPHGTLDSAWWHDRQHGPAELAQPVTYRFYRRRH